MTYTTERVSRWGRLKALFNQHRNVFYIFLSFCSGLVLSAAVEYSECTSYGAAMVGAMGAGGYGAASLLGCGIGYSLFFGFDEAAAYIASAVVIYTISFVCQYSPIYKARLFAVLNVSLVLGITLAFDSVSTVRGDTSYYLELILEVVRGAIMVYVYQISMQPLASAQKRFDIQRTICLFICISSFIHSCVGFQFIGVVSVGRILYDILLLAAVQLMEPVLTCFTALFFSLAVSASGQEAVQYLYFSVLYLVGCMMLGVKTKKMSVFLFVSATIVFSYFSDVAYDSVLYETVIAIVVYSLIPPNCYSALRLYLRYEKNEAEYSITNASEDRGDYVAELLLNISELLNQSNIIADEGDSFEALQCAVERVCNGCGKRDICWGNHQSELLQMFLELKNTADRRGKLRTEDFSERFVEYCAASQVILTEINYELRSRTDKRLYETSLKDKIDITGDILRMISNVVVRVSKQEAAKDSKCLMIERKTLDFLRTNKIRCAVSVSMVRDGIIRIELQGNEIKKLLKSFQYIEVLSETLNMRLRVMKGESAKDSIILYEAEPYAVSVGVATKKKKGEPVCGDSHSYFKTEQGIFYVILSDGLGTGEHAEKQSSFLIHLMERFIISDLLPLESVRLTNMIVSLNNEEQWDCATIDFLCVDLYTGKTEIFKMGAAPSYLNSKNAFRKITENMLCAGNIATEPLQVYHESFLLQPSDTIILLSDGIVVENEEHIREMISKETESMKFLARSILVNSQNTEVSDDDMTVIAIKMEHRL